MGLRTIKPLIRTFDGRAVKPEKKVAASIYSSPEFRKWREIIIARANRRCEWIEQGQRCLKAEPRHRMFADHKIEIRDGGAPFDPANGQCLCGAHHTLKTAAERTKRLGRRAEG